MHYVRVNISMLVAIKHILFIKLWDIFRVFFYECSEGTFCCFA